MEAIDIVPDTIYPGALFESKAAFKLAIAEDAVESRRRCIFPDNNSKQIAAKSTDAECDYVVRGRVRATGAVAVSSCHVFHSCRSSVLQSVSSALVEQVAQLVLACDVNAKASDVIARARAEFGYTVTYMQAYRAIEKLQSTARSRNAASYGLISPWLHGQAGTNPGSIIDVQRSPNGNITRSFVLLNSWARSLAFCLPVLSLDACHLKCKDGGTLFLASALSPNRDIVIVAAGLGLIEDSSHWQLFVERLRTGTDIQERDDTVVMSDREKGLDSALVAALPEVPHGFCSFHLKKNVVLNFKADLKGKVNSLAKALALHEARTILSEIDDISGPATEYVKDVGNSKWITAYFARPRLGITTTNMSEASNSWLLGERDQTWFSCLSGIVQRIQQRMYDKRREYARMHTEFVPMVIAEVKRLTEIGRQRHVMNVSTGVREVRRNSTRTYAVVDIEQRTCNFWSEFQYPCVHACAAILDRGGEPNEYISDYYRTTHLQQVFSPYSRPIDVAYLQDDGTLPPTITKRRGRPKKLRLRNRSEYVNDDSPYRCSQCTKAGHNVRTCERRSKGQNAGTQL